MIWGVGIDTVDIQRFRKVLDRKDDGFLADIYTEEEISYCRAKIDVSKSFAIIFAVKEAVLKALGTGLSIGYVWKNIEIPAFNCSKTEFNISGKVLDFLDRNKISRLKINIDSTSSTATAIAILEKNI